MKKKRTDLELKLTWWNSARTLRIIIERSSPRIDFTPRIESIKTWNAHSNLIVELTTTSKINRITLMRSWLRTAFLTWRKSKSSSKELKIPRLGPNLILFGWSTTTLTTLRMVMSNESRIKKSMRMRRTTCPNYWSKKRLCWLIDCSRHIRLSSKWKPFYKRLVTRAQSSSFSNRNKPARRNMDCTPLQLRNEFADQWFKF